MAVATQMPVSEITTATALFCSAYGANPRAARKHLDPTPLDHFSEAWSWTETNQKLMVTLRKRPEVIAAGGYEFVKARGFFGRLFQKKSKGDELGQMMEDLKARKPQAPKLRSKKADDLRALVDEAFDAP